MKISKEIEDVVYELEYVKRKFPGYKSVHEGYAVILEELDELWDEIKKPRKERNNATMYLEAKQVACTAIRFMEMLNYENK